MNSVLIIGEPRTNKLSLLKHLVGNDAKIEVPNDSDHSGIVHSWTLETKYYKTDLHFWIDEYEDLQTWVTEFNEIYEEFIDALQVLVFHFKFSKGLESITQDLSHVKQIKLFDDLEVVGVGIGETTEDQFNEIEDLLLESNIELIRYSDDRVENEYKEKVGKNRVLEILQCHEWKQQENPGDDIDVSHTEEDYDDQVESFEQILKRIENAKDEMSTIPDEKSRNDLAMNLVNQIMKDIGI